MDGLGVAEGDLLMDVMLEFDPTVLSPMKDLTPSNLGKSGVRVADYVGGIDASGSSHSGNGGTSGGRRRVKSKRRRSGGGGGGVGRGGNDTSPEEEDEAELIESLEGGVMMERVRSNDFGSNGSRKESRLGRIDRSSDIGDSLPIDVITDPSIFAVDFPPELAVEFATLLFEIGLKNSSPKVLMGLMPNSSSFGVTTEHIKSHLQKHRIHHERSSEEFQSFFNDFLKAQFETWDSSKGWESSEYFTSISADHEEDATTGARCNDGSSSSSSSSSAPSSSFPSSSSHDFTSVATVPSASSQRLPRVRVTNKARSLDLITDTEKILKEWRLLFGEIVRESDDVQNLLAGSSLASTLGDVDRILCQQPQLELKKE